MIGPVLLAYDGSSDAKHAITAAGEFLRGPAVVLHVYPIPQPVPVAPPGTGITLPVDPTASDELDRQAEETARAVAHEGVELARAAGFNPEPQLAPGDGARAVWDAIISVGDQCHASVIVVGHGQLSWLEEKLLGSVSGGLVRHANRPVLVIPARSE